MKRPCRLFLLAATLCAALQLALGPQTARAQSSFYRATEEELAGAPGTLIRFEPMISSPDGASAYLILYRSTGLHSEPIAVSGVAIIPASASSSPRPVVAWAHPTTGIVPRCAPSLAIFIFQQIQGLRDMLDRGYAVVATDYPGLGTPGPHPYLVGVSEGRAVLDSVRAVRRLPGAHAGNRFAVWGHSQGGQAALYAGLLAKSYAPDIELAGIAAAAPATELVTLMTDDLNSSGGRNLTAMTLWSWQRVFGAPMDRALEPDAIPVVDALADECIESIYDIVLRQRISRPLAESFLAIQNPATIEPWRSLANENTPGILPKDIPVFLAQGGADMLVRPAVTQNYMERLCRAGSRVSMLMVPKSNHGFIGRDSARTAVGWIADRFAGLPSPSDCASIK